MAKTTINTPLSVNVSEAARMLDVSRPIIHKLIDQGTIRCYQISDRLLRIPIADIHALIGIGDDNDSSNPQDSGAAAWRAIHDVRGAAHRRSTKSSRGKKA